MTLFDFVRQNKTKMKGDDDNRKNEVEKKIQHVHEHPSFCVFSTLY